MWFWHENSNETFGSDFQTLWLIFLFFSWLTKIRIKKSFTSALSTLSSGHCTAPKATTNSVFHGSSNPWNRTTKNWALTLGFMPNVAFCHWSRTWPSTWSACGTRWCKSASVSSSSAKFMEKMSRLSSNSLWKKCNSTGEKIQWLTRRDY